jgi:hypothetical protein
MFWKLELMVVWSFGLFIMLPVVVVVVVVVVAVVAVVVVVVIVIGNINCNQ